MSELIKKFYNGKPMAMIMGSQYVQQEKQTVYLHESCIGRNQYQYSLRFRSEILNPESANILRTWKYLASGRIDARIASTRPERTATGYDANLPAGLSHDPGDDPDMVVCPTCQGDSKKHDSEHCFTCESEGEITEMELKAYKEEIVYDRQANEA